jgi:sulfur carrier protein ThiS
MSASIRLRNREYEVEGNISLGKVFKRLNLNNQAILAIRKGTLITEDEIINETDVIELVEVISGG